MQASVIERLRRYEDNNVEAFHHGRITRKQANQRIQFAQQQITAGLIKLTVGDVLEQQKSAPATN